MRKTYHDHELFLLFRGMCQGAVSSAVRPKDMLSMNSLEEILLGDMKNIHVMSPNSKKSRAVHSEIVLYELRQCLLGEVT